MITIIILTLWVAGAISAYTRHKKWCIKNGCASGVNDKEWHNKDMIQTIVICLFFWIFIWMFSCFDKIDDLCNTEGHWLNKKSKI